MEGRGGLVQLRYWGTTQIQIVQYTQDLYEQYQKSHSKHCFSTRYPVNCFNQREHEIHVYSANGRKIDHGCSPHSMPFTSLILISLRKINYNAPGKTIFEICVKSFNVLCYSAPGLSCFREIAWPPNKRHPFVLPCTRWHLSRVPFCIRPTEHHVFSPNLPEEVNWDSIIRRLRLLN